MVRLLILLDYKNGKIIATTILIKRSFCKAVLISHTTICLTLSKYLLYTLSKYFMTTHHFHIYLQICFFFTQFQNAFSVTILRLTSHECYHHYAVPSARRSCRSTGHWRPTGSCTERAPTGTGAAERWAWVGGSCSRHQPTQSPQGRVLKVLPVGGIIWYVI